MRIGAINSFNTNFKGYNNYRKNNQDRPLSYDEMKEQEQNRNSLCKNIKNNLVAGTMVVTGLGAVAACSPGDIDVKHTHNILIDCKTINGKNYLVEHTDGGTVYRTDTTYKQVPIYLPGDTIWKTDTIVKTIPGKTDTLIVTKPGKTDTLIVTKRDTQYIDRPVIVRDTIWKTDTVVVEKPIYIPGDSIYVQPDFKSPVADTIKADLGDVDITPQKDGIPVDMIYYDEYENMANELKFNGPESSPNRLVYDETKLGWYGDKNYYRVEFSLNGGSIGGLIMKVKKSDTDGSKPSSELGWKDFKTYLFKRNGKGQLIKFEVNDGIAKEIGIVRKGDKANSVLNDYKLANGETQTFRYRDIKIVCHDLKYDDLYKEYQNESAQANIDNKSISPIENLYNYAQYLADKIEEFPESNPKHDDYVAAHENLMALLDKHPNARKELTQFAVEKAIEDKDSQNL